MGTICKSKASRHAECVRRIQHGGLQQQWMMCVDLMGRVGFSRTARAVCFSFALALSGCDVRHVVSQLSVKKTFHQNFNLVAEDFFDDSQVVALCKAIERNDFGEMQRLIDAGVDVNALGKDNATPLLWAFPDDQPVRFEMLLRAGADPNVKLTGNLGVVEAFKSGDSVTLRSAMNAFPSHFDLVMRYGGDPNITDKYGNPILHKTVFLSVDRHRRIRALVEHGADINALDSSGCSAAICAVTAFQQYDLAVTLLDLGCDHKVPRTGFRSRLVHYAVRMEERLHQFSPETQSAHGRLLQKLADLGEDLEQARKEAEYFDMHWTNQKKGTQVPFDPNPKRLRKK